jgi:hypothetical protein
VVGLASPLRPSVVEMTPCGMASCVGGGMSLIEGLRKVAGVRCSMKEVVKVHDGSIEHRRRAVSASRLHLPTVNFGRT